MKNVLRLATLAVVSLAFVSPVRADETTGQIKSVNPDNKQVVIQCQIPRAATLTLTADAQTKFFRNGAQADMKDLKENDRVSIQWNQNKLQALSAYQNAQEATGRVKSVDANEMVIQVAGKDIRYQHNNQTRFLKAGSSVQREQIREGDTVALLYQQSGGNQLAREVVIPAVRPQE